MGSVSAIIVSAVPSTMRVALVFLAILALAAARLEKRDNRIVGGTVASISEYPFSAAILYHWQQTDFRQWYGGSILNQRSILTTARNFHYLGCCVMNRWRIRVGSSYASSGGTVHIPSQIISHRYNPNGDNDVAIMRLATLIDYIPNIVAPVRIAGYNYTVPDDTPVWAIGWGRTTMTGTNSEQLNHVQVWTINQEVCRERYATLNWPVTDNMICSGWLDVGGRDQCSGDTGSPLLHDNVVIGLSSWGNGCGLPFYPGVNTRVSRYADWIYSIA